MEYEKDEKYKAIDRYVKEKLSVERYNHSIAVMNRALEFAKIYGANEQDAVYAGLIHDVAKEVPKNQRVLLAEELGIELDEIEKIATALIHAKIGAYIAKHTFNLKDEICNAVETHTTGCANMTLLQKIIYLADFTSEDRSFDGASKVYELAKKNLDEALIYALKLSITDVMNKGGFVHPKGIEAYNYLMLNKRK